MLETTRSNRFLGLSGLSSGPSNMYRMVPESMTDSGITLDAVPPLNFPEHDKCRLLENIDFPCLNCLDPLNHGGRGQDGIDGTVGRGGMPASAFDRELEMGPCRP